MSVSRWFGGLLATALAAAAPGPCAAGDDAYAGKAVRRDFTDAHGNRIAVTVTPPADRAVDTRFFAAIEVSDGEAGGVEEAAAEATGEPVDVSGYVVELERLSTAATCTRTITLKTKPVNLGGNKTFNVTSDGQPIFVSVTSFPKSGNVDAYVLNGSTPCNSSKKGSNQLDNAVCVSSSCVGQSVLIGQVKNPTRNNAQYVAAINMVFQAP
jgi:hypothetical protein